MIRVKKRLLIYIGANIVHLLIPEVRQAYNMPAGSWILSKHLLNRKVLTMLHTPLFTCLLGWWVSVYQVVILLLPTLHHKVIEFLLLADESVDKGQDTLLSTLCSPLGGSKRLPMVMHNTEHVLYEEPCLLVMDLHVGEVWIRPNVFIGPRLDSAGQ